MDGIVGGYSSDSDSGDESDNGVVYEIVDDDGEGSDNNDNSDDNDSDDSDDSDSDDDNAIDLNDLSDSDSEDSDSQHEQFIQLLNDKRINPFGSWDNESSKLIEDQIYLQIQDHKTRKRWFDEWASAKVQELNNNNDDDNEEQNTISNDENNEIIEDNDPFITYMNYLNSKPQRPRLFIDFKKQNQDELDSIIANQSGIRSISINDMEKSYRELSVFLEKPIDFKIKVFNMKILNSKIFQRDVKQSIKESFKNDNNETKIEKDWQTFKSFYNNDLPNYIQNTTTLNQNKILIELEKVINLPDSLIHDTKYHIVHVSVRLGLIWDECLKIEKSI